MQQAVFPAGYLATDAAALAARPRLFGIFASCTVASVALAAAWWSLHPPIDPALPPAEPIPLQEPVALAQAQVAPSQTVEIEIRRNDTLEALFRRLRLSLSDLAELRALPEVRKSLDRLTPGDVIMLTHLNGALESLTRRLSDTATLVVTRDQGSFAADVIETPLEVRSASLAGTVTSSLFGAVSTAGGSDPLAVALADVFKYDIDFVNEVQPGDSFVVAYEKKWREGEFVRDGDIVAAEFVNRGRVFRAVRYVMPDGSVEYFTPEGNNVRKAFLRFPVSFARVSSGFSRSRRHPVLNIVRAHKGIDFAAPVGTPIKAAGSGRIIERGRKGGYGNAIVLAHPGGVTTLYGHMSRFKPGMLIGQKVKQGEVIGYVGMTGLASGAHLHYEYRVGGVHRNPATIKFPSAESIPAGLREDFLASSAPLLAQLDALRTAAETRITMAEL